MKICKMLGMAAGYYFWIIHRIGTKSTTRFTIALAAKELEVNRRTIERWDKVLTKLGFISIKHRSHAGLRTYSEYKAVATGYDTSVARKRA
jgi:hypothetical protein